MSCFSLIPNHCVQESQRFGALEVPNGCRDSLGLLVQQVEERGGLLADQVDAAGVVDVVDVVPADALGPVLLLHRKKKDMQSVNTAKRMKKYIHSCESPACERTQQQKKSIKRSTPRDITKGTNTSPGARNNPSWPDVAFVAVPHI